MFGFGLILCVASRLGPSSDTWKLSSDGSWAKQCSLRRNSKRQHVQRWNTPYGNDMKCSWLLMGNGNIIGIWCRFNLMVFLNMQNRQNHQQNQCDSIGFWSVLMVLDVEHARNTFPNMLPNTKMSHNLMTIWWHSKYSKWHRTSWRAEAYPYLFAAGSWQNLFLYRGHTWNAEICAVMPHTCELLLPEIPTKPGLPYVMPNNEEIVLFRSVGGAYVGPHTGAVNNQINIHLTLKGGTGVYLEVGSSVSNRSRFRFFGVLFLYFLQLCIQGRWGKSRIASWQSRVLSGRRAAPAHAFAVCEAPLIHLVMVVHLFHAHPQRFSLFVFVWIYWKQDSYLHSLEHDDESQERLSLVPLFK